MKFTLLISIIILSSCLRDQKIDSLIQAQETQKRSYQESLSIIYKKGLEDSYYQTMSVLQNRGVLDSVVNEKLDLLELEIKLKLDSLGRKFYEKD